MSLPKSLFFCALTLFGSIGCVALWKKRYAKPQPSQVAEAVMIHTQTVSSASSGNSAPPLRIALDESIEALPEEKSQERKPLLQKPEHPSSSSPSSY